LVLGQDTTQEGVVVIVVVVVLWLSRGLLDDGMEVAGDQY
jgi:hypothetical protein